MIPQLQQEWIRLFRRHTREDLGGRAHVRARSIYILPTRQGLLLVGMLLLMLVGSLNYGSNLGYLVTFLLGGVWLSTILHTWRNLLGLVISPVGASAVFAGQPAVFTLRVDNPSRLARFGIGLELPRGSGGRGDIPAGAAVRLQVSQTTRQRGRLPLDDVTLSTRYPLGLFRAWTYVRVELECLVYPAPADQGEPPREAVYRRSDVGHQGVGADDFIGLRNFRPGDSPRHIDWKVLARERGLLCKQFGGDRNDQISLDWELLPPVGAEQRLRLLSRFVLLAEEQQLSYGLKLPSLTIPMGRGEHQMHRCLRALALFEAGS